MVMVGFAMIDHSILRHDVGDLSRVPAKGSMAGGSDGQVVVGDAVMHEAGDLEPGFQGWKSLRVTSRCRRCLSA